MEEVFVQLSEETYNQVCEVAADQNTTPEEIARYCFDQFFQMSEAEQDELLGDLYGPVAHQESLRQLVRDCIDYDKLEQLYLSCNDDDKRIVKSYANSRMNSALKYRKN